MTWADVRRIAEAAMQTQQTLARMIVERLEQDAREHERNFASPAGRIPTRHLVVDDLLPADIAREF